MTEELHPNRIRQIEILKRLVSGNNPTNKRFVTVWVYEESQDVKMVCDAFGEAMSVIIDTQNWTPVGSDGGEPEDARLLRDWSWVEYMLNSVHEEKL
mgnify:FL=1